MGAYAYCDKCDTPIHKCDYTASDIITGSYKCTQCQAQNEVFYRLDEFLQDLVDRIYELETKIENERAK